MFILIAWRETNKIGQHAEPEIIGVYETRPEAERQQRLNAAEYSSFNIQEIDPNGPV